MAFHIEAFDNILGSWPLKVFFLLENRMRVLVREFSLIRESSRECVEHFLRKWCERRRLVWNHCYYKIHILDK